MAQFYLIYIREAHPNDEIKQPKTWEERKELASNFVTEMNLSIPTLIDGIDNETESNYKGWPDRMYIVDKDGKVMIKGEQGPWGFKPLEIIPAALDTITRIDAAGKLFATWGAFRINLRDN